VDEGWLGNDYLILFAGPELHAASERYTISDWLPGYEVAGLRGWDDLILRDAAFRTFSIPAVPLDLKYLEPFALPECGTTLEYDHRFAGKIKWYVHRLYSAARSPTRIRLGLIIQLTAGSLGFGTSYIVQSSHRSGPSDYSRFLFHPVVRSELPPRQTSAK
jgi:hypothetical protein